MEPLLQFLEPMAPW